MDWTAEAIDQLRAFWAEGQSTAEIGRRMGITKNAVVGKAHRLELPARPSPIRRDDTIAASRPAASRQSAAPAAHPLVMPRPSRSEPHRADPTVAQWPAAPAALQPAAQPDPQPGPAASTANTSVRNDAGMASLPLMVVRPFPRLAGRSCCWPMGDPGTAEFRFCSGDAIAGKPYCQDHAAVAYVKPRDRREDAA